MWSGRAEFDLIRIVVSQPIGSNLKRGTGVLAHSRYLQAATGQVPVTDGSVCT